MANGLELGTAEQPYATIYGSGETPDAEGMAGEDLAGAFQPPGPAMVRLSMPAAPPAVAPVGGPGEAGPPEESGPLTDMWEPVQRAINETYAEYDRRGRELLEQSAAATSQARAELKAGYERYGQAGQEAIDLAERQRLARPPLTAPPVEPAVPQQRFEPFGTGPEKETGMQALNRITMTLGLIAQMGIGLKSGYTSGAMAAFNGALDGWAKGQKIKGDQEWRQYLANVQKMDREWARERQYQDDILKRDAVDLDRAKLKMAIRQTELGYNKEMVALTLRDVDQRIKMYGVEGQMFQHMMRDTMQVMTQRLLGDFRTRQQNEIENWHRQQKIAQDLTRQLQEQRDKVNEDIRRQNMAQTMTIANMADATRREAIEQRREAATERAARAGGVQAREAEQAAQMSRDAINGLAAIYNDPKQKAVVDKWIGPTGPLWKMASENLSGAPSLGMVPQLPPEVVAANKYVADLTLHTRKLLSGRAVTQYEGKPLLDALPTIKDQPDVFWQKAAMSESNVSRLEKEAVRDPTQPLTWDPMTTPAGGAAGIAAGPRTGSFATPPPLSPKEYQGKSVQQGDDFFYSDGKTWTRLKKKAGP